MNIRISLVGLLMSLVTITGFAEENRYYITLMKVQYHPDDTWLCTGDIEAPLWLHIYYSDNIWSELDVGQNIQTLTLHEKPIMFTLFGRIGKRGDGVGNPVGPDDKNYNNGDGIMNFKISGSKKDGQCTRTLDAEYNVLVDDPIVIESVNFIDENNIDKTGRNIACTNENFRVKVVTKKYYVNTKSTYQLQIYNKSNSWQTLTDRVLNSGGDAEIFTWDQLSSYVNFGQAIRFRTVKQLNDNSYSYNSSTNYLYYFPGFGSVTVNVIRPDCYEGSPTIRVSSSNTSNCIITIKGNYAGAQGYNFNTQNLTQSGGYYIITENTPSMSGQYPSFPLGVTDSIIIEHESASGLNTPCAFKSTFPIPNVPQFVLNNISYQTNLTDNNGNSVQVSTIGGTGRVNCSVQGSRLSAVNIVSGSTIQIFYLTSYTEVDGWRYYYGSAYIDLPAGTHSIRATNSDNCESNSATVVLNEPDPVSFSPSATDISCNALSISGNENDGTITLNDLSGGIGSYTFSPSASLIDGKYVISGLSYNPSGHNVTVTDQYNNHITINVPVGQYSAVTCSFSDASAPVMSCTNNGQVTIINVQGGESPYSYSRINSLAYFSSDNVVTGFPPGIQPVYILDDNGCVFSYAATIPGAPPSIAIQYENIVPPVCYDNDNGSYTAVVSNILGTMSVTSSDPRIFSSDISIVNDTIVVKNLEAGIYSIDVTDAYNGYSCDTTYYFGIPEKPPISISSVITPVQGKGTATGSIEMEISGGNAGRRSVYLYDSDINLLDSTIISGNTAIFDTLSGQYPDGGKPYYVEITDSLSCRFSVDNGHYYLFRIREPEDTLNLTLTLVSGISCNGEADAVVRAVPEGGWSNYSFAYNNTNEFVAGDIFYNIPMGLQHFYVIDSMGAIDSTTIDIIMPEGLSSEIAFVDSVKCYGTPTGSVYFTITGGTPPYRNAVLGAEEQWQNGDVATGLSVGLYTFVFTDTNNCVSFDTLSAYVPTPDTLQFADIEVVQSTCNSNNAYIQVEMLGGSMPYSYLWNDYFGNFVGSGPRIDSLEQSGYYFLEVTDKNGCTQHFEQAINPSDGPSIGIVEINHVKCFGDSTGSARVTEVFPATPFAPWWLTWSNGDVAESASGFPAGFHFVSVTDTNNCVFTKYFIITNPDRLSAEITGFRDAHCYGYNDGFLEVEGLGGVGSYSFAWSNGDVTNRADSLYVGSYTVQITDLNQCQSELTFEVTQPDIVMVDLGDDIVICPGNTITLDGLDFTTHNWSTPSGLLSNQRFVEISNANEYYLEVTDTIGCYARDTLILTVGSDALKADFLMTSEAFQGDTLTIYELSNMELDSLQWEYNTEVFKDITDSLAAYYVLELENSDTGIYNVTLRAYSGGCISQAVKQVEIIYDNDTTDDNYGLGYKDPLITSFIVSPNPNEGTFNVKINLREESDIRLVIFSISYGVKVDDRFGYGLKDYELIYNLNGLDAGTYVIMLNAGDERKQVKMIIL